MAPDGRLALKASGIEKRYDQSREVHFCEVCHAVFSYKRLDDRTTSNSVRHNCPLKPGGNEKCGGGMRCQGWGVKTNTPDPNKKNDRRYMSVYQSNPCWKLLKNKKGMDYVKTCIKKWKDGAEYEKFLLSSPAIDENEHDDD